MNLETWICWAFRPISRGRHHLQSKTLVKQAVRDLGGPIDHAAFCAAMVRAASASFTVTVTPATSTAPTRLRSGVLPAEVPELGRVLCIHC